MGEKFVPEMHDLGKLIKRGWHRLTTDGKALRVHTDRGPSFDNLDWAALNLEKVSFDNATWFGIVYHMDKTTKWVRDLSEPLPEDIAIGIEDRVRLFLTIIADHLAATTGRALGEKEKKVGPEEAEVYRLWNPDFAADLKAELKIKPVPIDDDEALRKAIELVKNETDWDGYLEEYGPSMQICAEDKDAARRVTSLLSHSELLGKFYRVLEGAVQLLDNPPRLVLGETATKVGGAEGAEAKWVGRLVRATVKFHQQPVRPADVGIFDHLRGCHKAFAQAYPDNLLFASADTLWLFLPGRDEPKLANVLKEYGEAGFYVECEMRTDTLGRLGVWFSEEVAAQVKQDLERQRWDTEQRIEELAEQITMLEEHYRALGLQIRETAGDQRQQLIDERKRVRREQGDVERAKKELAENLGALEEVNVEEPELSSAAFYPRDIRRALDPPICEICQMRPGEPVQFGTTTDYLCSRCQEIRKGGFRQRELGKWLEEGRGRVLWLQIGLDARQLERTVARLFGDYVDAIKDKGKPLSEGARAQMKANLRMPALLRDFVADYQILLGEMGSFLRGLGDPKYFASLTADTWVLPVRRGRQVDQILREYQALMKRHFPELVDGLGKVPICLGMSIGPAKYPFYQHWRYISDPPDVVSVRLVGSASLEVGLEGLWELLAVDLHAHDKQDRQVGWEAYQGRTYLHRLAAIEQRSGSTGLVTATFLSEMGRKVPRPLREFKEALEAKKLRMGDILAYYKLMSFGEGR